MRRGETRADRARSPLVVVLGGLGLGRLVRRTACDRARDDSAELSDTPGGHHEAEDDAREHELGEREVLHRRAGVPWRAVALEVVVGLGSNLGDRRATLDAALVAIATLPGTDVVARTEPRETAPVGGPPQGPFLNAAALLATTLAPRALLDALLAIERANGRERRERWGPRTLDLDVLWIAGLVVDEPGLAVPHPHLLVRSFALAPLVELVPDARDPRTGARYADALDALERG